MSKLNKQIKWRIFSVIALLFMLFTGVYATNQITSITRQLPTTANINTPFNVTINANINEFNTTSGTYLVEEDTPAGLNITNVKDGLLYGNISSGYKIYWFVADKCANIYGFKILCPYEDKTFTYTAEATIPTTYVFNGYLSTADNEKMFTTGDTQIIIGSGSGGNIDTIPPNVGSITPTSVNTNQTQTYSVDVNDNVGVVSCDFYINNQKIQAMTIPSSCPSCVASTTHIFNNAGDYSVFASCKDAAGNSKNGSAVVIHVTDRITDIIPPTLTNIQVSDITDKQATISWTTNEKSNSKVFYGYNTDYGNQKNSSSMVIGHSITLTDLTPSSTYHFKVSSKDAAGNINQSMDKTFTTSPLLSDMIQVSRNMPNSVEINQEFNLTYNINVNQTQDNFYYLITENIPQHLNVINSTAAYFYAPARKLYIQGYHTKGNNEDKVIKVLMKANSTGTYKINGQLDISEGTFSILGDNTIIVTNGNGGPTPQPPIISEISLDELTSTSAVVSWKTDTPSTSIVKYGLSYGSYTYTAIGDSSTTAHSVVLSGLTPSTTYYYIVESTNNVGTTHSNEQTFTTSMQSDTTPPVISNIVVSSVTGNSAVITWTTNESANGTVQYGTNTSYGLTKGHSNYIKSHSITLTNLNSGTTYHFKVSSSDSSGNAAQSSDYTFTTTQENYPLSISNVQILDYNFNPATSIHAGGQVNIKVNVQNNGQSSLNPMQIVEVLDGSTPIFIGTVKANINSGENSEITVGFVMPTSAVTGHQYTVKVFNWNHWLSQGSSQNGWQAYSSQYQTSFNVA